MSNSHIQEKYEITPQKRYFGDLAENDDHLEHDKMIIRGIIRCCLLEAGGLIVAQPGIPPTRLQDKPVHSHFSTSILHPAGYLGSPIL